MSETRIGFDFVLRGLRGQVDVNVGPNEDPAALGCRPSGRGFPVCTAAVTYAGRGYAAMLGWIQLVRSSDNASRGEFELDPFEPLGATPHPFAWFGLTPTLFDAPSRGTTEALDWLAHSFLAFIGDPLEARAILGFSWGFRIVANDISLTAPARLLAAQWDEHLPLLRAEHPSWRFAAGYRRE
jgi:hypothetical protein